MLGLGELRHSVVRSVVSAVFAKPAYRQHIAVGIISGRGHTLPGFALVKHIVQFVPNIPKIACQSPHICVFAKMVCLFTHCRSGRKRQNNFSAAVVNRLAQHFNFIIGTVRIVPLSELRHTNIVALYKIDIPTCVHIYN